MTSSPGDGEVLSVGSRMARIVPRRGSQSDAARGNPRADACDDERFQPVEIAALTAAYDVRATDPDVAARILARAVPRLQAEARLGRHVHLGVAGPSVVVLLETDDSWSHRLHATFGENHALDLGETLDLMHDVIRAVSSARDD